MQDAGLTSFEQRHERLVASTELKGRGDFVKRMNSGLSLKGEGRYIRSGEWVELPTEPQSGDDFRRSWE